MIGGEDDLSNFIDEQAGLTSTTTDTSVDTGDTGVDKSVDTGTVDGTPEAKTGKTEDKAAEKKPDPAEQQAKQVAKDKQPVKDDQSKPKIKKTPHGHLVDDKGNIVDAQGNILAPMGRARRIYEDNERLTRNFARLQEDHNRLNLQFRETQLLNGIPQQYGLNNDDVAQALDMAGRLKRGDVLGVAKDVIALISARGHNISELLGTEVGDSIDMRAVKAMLDERLGPVQRRTEQETRQQEQQEQGRRDYERFVSDNEYATVHGEAIVNLSRKNGISIQQAYNRIRDFAYMNGMDFSMPLGPQIAEKMQADQGNQNDQQQQQQRRPLPGNGAKTRETGGAKPAQPVYADPDESWDAIIRRAM